MPTFLKLAAVAVITEGGAGNFGSSSSGSGTGGAGLHLSAGLIAVIILGVVLSVALGIFVFYLITRLRFAFFHCLVHQTKEIRPAWRLYRVQALRFFKLSVVVGVVMVLIAAMFALPLVFMYQALKQPPGPSVAFVVSLFILTVVAVIVFILFVLADIVMRDFMLPHMAFENASAGEAWAAVRVRIAAEPWEFGIYLLLRLVLPLIALGVLGVIVAIPFAAVVGFWGLFAAGSTEVFTQMTGTGKFLLIALGVPVGIFLVCFAVFVVLGVFGPLGVCVRNYALLFYGGRYQALGELLRPPPPLPPPSYGL